MSPFRLILILNLVTAALLAQSKDNLRFMDLLQPEDTLRFNNIYEGIYGITPEVLRNQQTSSRQLAKDLLVKDSIPQYKVYLYSDRGASASGIREFTLAYQMGDTALTTSFKTSLPASLVDLKLVVEGDHPVIQIDYIEYQSSGSGSTEMNVAAFFMLEGFCLPLTRVIRKLWLSENGNYEAACKDYQYFSVEFSREVSYREGYLKLGRGDYKFSENLNCEAVSQNRQVPAGKYFIKDYLVLKE